MAEWSAEQHPRDEKGRFVSFGSALNAWKKHVKSGGLKSHGLHASTLKAWRNSNRADIQKASAPKVKPSPVRESKKLASEPRPAHHEAAHWEAEYKHLGPAAKQAAYGRAMLELGLDSTPSDAIAAVKHIAKGNSGLETMIHHLSASAVEYPGRTMRDLIQNVYTSSVDGPWRAALQSFAAMGAHRNAIKGRTMKAEFRVGKNAPPAMLRALTKAGTFYQSMVHQSRSFGKVSVVHDPDENSRSYFLEKEKRMSTGMDSGRNPTIVEHELGHALEANNADARKAVLAFRKARQQGSPLEDMADLQPEYYKRGEEFTKADKFVSPYIGKIYDYPSTEIMSSAIEYMAREPHTLMEHDPEMFHFALGVMAGDKVK